MGGQIVIAGWVWLFVRVLKLSINQKFKLLYFIKNKLKHAK
jgi:hypothetical protein